MLSARASRSDFLGDSKGSVARAGGLRNGPADYKIICSSLDGFGGRGDARLVIQRCAGWTHTGNNDEEVRAAGATDGLCFVRGGDNSIELRLLCEASERKRSRGRRS